ncbi:MAG: glycoside hydrolase family 95 protein [Acidobacteriota bacterium]
MGRTIVLQRRILLEARRALILVVAAALNAAVGAADTGLRLTYENPASKWTEALPFGYGRLGAMVFGGIRDERIQLNEDTLWAGGPYDPNNPHALENLAEARRLIFAGKYREAHELVDQKMLAHPRGQLPYETVGDLRLAFLDLGEVSDYRRELNLDTAVTSVTYKAGGVTCRREAFSSPVDQVIVIRLSADQPGRVSFAASMTTPQKATVQTEDGNTLVMSGVNGDSSGIKGALTFQARVHVAADGGQVTDEGDRISVRNADSAVLLIAAATSYKRYDDVTGDPQARTRDWISAAQGQSFDELLAAHIKEHQRLFRRVQLDLGRTAAADLPTDERIRNSGTDDDPQLAALYFQFGRYLLISSSRPGSQPANLPDGWVCHHNTDLWRATAPIDGAAYGIWPTGGAWLCKHVWDHYEYTGDQAFLRAMYPVMKGAAEFFLSSLVEEPTHHWLVTCPSLSPENPHKYGVAVTAGPTMDNQIIRDLFSNCMAAAQILGVDEPFQEHVAAARARLAPNQIGKEGQLQEWLEDWDMEAPELHHRHVSHLYGLFPSDQINVEDTPELAAAARKSLEIRGDEATGWGLGWRLNLWARLHDGDHAYKILQMLLRPDRTYPNMFDAHPPFQIDGNFGGTSGIAEMLMQSRARVTNGKLTSEIELLPALPGVWPTGSVKGLRAKGGFEVDIAWKDGRLRSATLRSLLGTPCRLRYGSRVENVTIAANETYEMDGR